MMAGTSPARARQLEGADGHDKLLSSLPDVVRAIAEPLSKVDKITVVSTGDGGSGATGVSRVTADVAQVVAQVPAIIESLSGVSVGDLLRGLPRLGEAALTATGSARAPSEAPAPTPPPLPAQRRSGDASPLVMSTMR